VQSRGIDADRKSWQDQSDPWFDDAACIVDLEITAGQGAPSAMDSLDVDDRGSASGN